MMNVTKFYSFTFEFSLDYQHRRLQFTRSYEEFIDVYSYSGCTFAFVSMSEILPDQPLVNTIEAI